MKKAFDFKFSNFKVHNPAEQGDQGFLQDDAQLLGGHHLDG